MWDVISRKKKIEEQFDFVDKIYQMRQEIRVNGSNSKIKRRKINQTKYKWKIEEKATFLVFTVKDIKNIKEKLRKILAKRCYDYIHFLESDFKILKGGLWM